MRALAEWLYVPTDWLRFGVLDEKATTAEGGLGSVFEPKAIAILKRLDDYNKSLAEAFIFMLDEQQRKIWIHADLLWMVWRASAAMRHGIK